MAGFEPISGTMGAIALVDRMFQGVIWVYGQYKITEEFGVDFVEYSDIYESEIVRFEKIRDASVAGLTEDPLREDRRKLKPQLRNRFLQWVRHLEACEELIRRCESGLSGPGSRQFDVESLDASTGAIISPIPTLINVQTASSSAVSTTPDTPQLGSGTSTPGYLSDKALSITMTEGSEAQKSHEAATHDEATPASKSFSTQFRKFLKPLRMGRRSSSKGRGRSRDSADRRQQIIPSRQISLDPEDRRAMSERDLVASEVQSQISARGRVSWLSQRKKFIELLDKLEGHGNFFTSMIQIDHSHQETMRIAMTEKLRPRIARQEDAGQRLKRLLKSMEKLQGSRETELRLMMHNDPFELSSSLRKGGVNLQHESAAFYMRLKDNAVVGAEPTTGQVAPRGKDGYRIFDVAAEQKNPGQTSTPQLLGKVEELLVASANETGLLGFIDSTIQVLPSGTNHSDGLSMRQSFAKEDEKAFFRNPLHAKTRARLSLVAVTSLLYCLVAQGPNDLDADTLQYYPALDTQGQELDLEMSRINPFVLLELTPLASAVQPSVFAAALSSAALPDTPGKVMVQKLGILIFEIGVWETCAGESHLARVEAARTGKEATAMVHPKFRDAIRECLDCTGDVRWTEWLFWNVIEPLEKAVKKLDEVRMVPTPAEAVEGVQDGE